jgi:AcrR family transcriptional regulator
MAAAGVARASLPGVVRASGVARASSPGVVRASGVARASSPGVVRVSGVARVASPATARLADRSLPREQVLALQRSRLTAAAIAAIDELGWGHATVGQIIARAGVSRRTFYDLFANREGCLCSILEDVASLVSGELVAAGLEGLSWRERVRGGLWAILCFLDREPALARVCVVQAQCADPALVGARGEILARLAAVVDEGRVEGTRGAGCTSLTAEGVVGAAFTIVHGRLARDVRGEGGGEPVSGLLGELVGMVVLPYLGAAVARRERERSVPALPRPVIYRTPVVAPRSARDPLGGVRMRLTYRTARVLESVAELGGGGSYPSNRAVAVRAGVHDPGQISKLLRRLERLGLLANGGEGAHVRGEPNAWALTAKGEQVAHSIRLHALDGRGAA